MKKHILMFIVFLILSFLFSSDILFRTDNFCSTFSIVGYDPITGDLGIAVQSKFPNLRPVVPWAKANVGAVATQSFAKLEYGIRGLELMEKGLTAEEALRTILSDDPERDQRQVGMVDANGNAASWTGENCFQWQGGYVGSDNPNNFIKSTPKTNTNKVIVGKNFSAQGNILVSEETIKALANTFENTKGSLAEKLMQALIAGGKAGGDQRGEQSAALLVVRKNAGYDGQDNFIDISVYDHKTPIAELYRLYKLNNLYFTKSKPENMIPINIDIAKELQHIWKVRGFYYGEINGIVNKEFQKILIDFMGWENYDIRIPPVKNVNLAKGELLKIDKEVLQDIRKVFNEKRWKPKLK